MAIKSLSGVIKKEINGLLIKKSIDDICLEDLYIHFNHKQCYTYEQLTKYLSELCSKKMQTKSSFKYVAKTVRAINLVLSDSINLDIDMSKELYNLLTDLKLQYEDSINLGIGEENKILRQEFDSFGQLINTIRLENSEEKVIPKVLMEDDNIDLLPKEIYDSKQNDDELDKEEKENTDLLKKQKKDITKLENKVSSLKERIISKDLSISDKNRQIKNLGDENNELNKSIENYQSVIDDQIREIDKLKNDCQNFQKYIDNNEKNNQRKQFIENEVLNYLLSESITIDQIYDKMYQMFPTVKKSVLFRS